MVLLMETNAVNKPLTRPAISGGRADVNPQMYSPEVSQLAPEKWWFEVWRLYTFLLGPGNFSGANRETSGV